MSTPPPGPPPSMVSLPVIQVGRLADSRLQSAIDNAIAAIPAGQEGAINVGFTLKDGGNLTLVVGERIGDHFSVKAGFSIDIGGHPEGEAVLQGSW